MATLDDVREQANAALNTGDREGAFSLALLMQRHFPKDYQTLELLGKLYLEDRKLDDAREAFGRVLEIDPDNVVATAALAIAAEEEGDLEAALDRFEQAFDLDPTSGEIWEEIVRLHSQLSHSTIPDRGSSTHSVARRFLIEKRYESAIPWFKEALRADPSLANVAVGLTRALWLAWRPSEAEAIALKILLEHPDCLVALSVLAGAGQSQGSKESLALLARTVELNPGNGVARALFAEAGLDFPVDSEKADIPDSELERALSPGLIAVDAGSVQTPAESDSYAVPADLVEVSLPADQLASAPEAAEAVLDGIPQEVPDPIPTTGSEQMEAEGRPDDAEPGEPPQPQAASDHLSAAEMHLSGGRDDLAVADYRAALRLDHSMAPEIADALLQLAEAHPDNLKARWLAGDILATNGRFSQAVEQYLLVLSSQGNPQTVNPNGVESQN
jgi:tetratricopeptide (TPR) repeat protein